jgi:hypothetical protein
MTTTKDAKGRTIVRTTKQATLQAEIEQLKQQLAEAKAQTVKPISMKVSEKGACSVYGLGRFPVTLYAQQWNRLLDHSSDIKEFLVANADRLSVK